MRGRTALVIAVAGLCAAMAATYGYTGGQPGPMVMLGLALIPPIVPTLWIQADARDRHVGLVFDWGLFGYFLWPVFIPWYAFHTRGRRGWPLAAGLLLVALAPFAGILLGGMLGLAVHGGVP